MNQNNEPWQVQPAYVTYNTNPPDDFEETVTEEEWEEERNGVMVKVRKRTTKRTRKVSKPLPTFTSPSEYDTNTIGTDQKFNYVKNDAYALQMKFDELMKKAVKPDASNWGIVEA